MTQHLRKGVFAAFLLAVVAGMTAMPVMASNATIDYGADAAPQLGVSGDVTIADHPMGNDSLTYNNDNGEWTALPADVNTSVDNPFEFTASDVAFDDAGAFPHASDATALNASLWATDTSSSAGSMTVGETETAPGVGALSISTASQTSGDTAIASFDLTQTDVASPVTSDENKRYLQIVGDVNALDSGAAVNVQVVDADGDYYEAEINSSRSSGEDMIANATGEGVIYQAQLGTLTLNQVGDGTFNDIETVEVEVVDGNADVDISALNIDKMGTWDFGDQLIDTDDDDELESEQITEHKTGGPIAVSDLSTLGDTFSDAHIMDLTVPFVQTAEDLAPEDVSVEFTAADQYSNYESHFEGDFRFELRTAYDLSYSNLELTDEASVPATRYVSVEYAEGTGDTAFEDISSWSSISGSYDGVGADVSIDETVQPGTAMVVSFDYVITGDEQSALESAGAAMGPTGSSSGGLLGFIFSPLGMIVSGVTAFFAGKRKGVF
ncbi:hypothetical protein [Halorhabdus sp. CUG00001]|uniref:hypothetical protein n=1 Tax=Halorhabdus sp. CUG00001 TaxID=2600297 RepID=UPI00131E54A1|nr:hypothetical protein [Halorhabdus sp. CUG00001]